MAYVTMMRQPSTIGADNYQYPNSSTYQFYEVTLSSVAKSLWILIPNDGLPVRCMLGFTGTATAEVDATASPGSVVTGAYAATPVTVALIASGSANASADAAGYTAIQLNVTAWTSGNVTLSVRC